MKLWLVVVLVCCFVSSLFAQSTQMSTYCNPLNVDYTYMIYNSNNDISYRSGADPAVVKFRNEYYMFVTRSMGYWHSSDLTNWTFIIPKNGICRDRMPRQHIIIKIQYYMLPAILPAP